MQAGGRASGEQLQPQRQQEQQNAASRYRVAKRLQKRAATAADDLLALPQVRIEAPSCTASKAGGQAPTAKCSQIGLEMEVQLGSGMELRCGALRMTVRCPRPPFLDPLLCR
jgi:hypothetical protein